MRASELPDDVKQQVLRQIENQLGSDAYQRAVDSLGEEGLIGSLLAKDEEVRPRRRVAWGIMALASAFLPLLFVYGLGVWLLGGDQWWHHVLAVPAGLFFLWIQSRMDKLFS